MSYTLKIKADDAVQAWGLFLDKVPIRGFNEDNETSLDIMPGEHFFYYEVHGSGGKAEISLTGEPTPAIIVPENSTWPFKVEVPTDRTKVGDRIYFVIGQ